LRNPWGNFEWDGDWSDKSPLWTQELQEIAKISLEGDDGTFWMSFKDFIDHFDSLDVCRVRNWDEVRIRGRFVRYSDTDNSSVEVVQSKWLYAIDVPTKSHVLIGLHQEDQRIDGVLPRRPYLDFGIAVLKMDAE
jgi:calpain-15